MVFQRYGWDCSYTDWFPHSNCPSLPWGVVQLRGMFSYYSFFRFRRYLLNLVDVQGEHHGGNKGITRYAHQIHISPMHIVAYKFHLRPES